MSVAEKKEFIIKHVFADAMSMHGGNLRSGEVMYHFNVPWEISTIKFDDGRFSIYLGCHKQRVGISDWLIETETEIKLISTNGENLCKNKKYRYDDKNSSNYFGFSAAEIENCLVDGQLSVEMHVKITEINGIRTEKLRNFDESTKEFSDVVLIVEDEKFYVLKMYLASHSPYFNSIFFGDFKERKQSEISLNDPDAYNFQNYLEVIHGEPAVDEDTVEGILHLARMYPSKTAMRQCEKFLLETSKRNLKEKFEMAIEYRMDILRKKCLSEIKTKEEAISLAPKNAEQLEPAVLAELFNKIVSFQ